MEWAVNMMECMKEHCCSSDTCPLSIGTVQINKSTVHKKTVSQAQKNAHPELLGFQDALVKLQFSRFTWHFTWHTERGSPTLPAVSCSHGGGPDIHGTPASLEWRSSGMGFAEIMKIGTSTLESKGCSRNKQQEWEDQRWKEGIQHWGLKGGDQDLEQGEAGQGMAGPEGECSLREHHGAGVNEAPLLTLQTSGQILPSQGSGDLRTQSLLLGEQSTGMDCPRPPPDADQPRSLSFQSTNLDSYASPHISARTSRDVPTGLPSMPGEVVAVVSPVLLQPQQPKQQHPEQQSEQQQPLQITALLPGDFNPGCQDLPCNPKPTSPGEGPSSGLLTSAGTDSSGANSSGIAVQDCPPVALDAGLKSGGVAVPDPPGSSTQPLRKLPLPLLQHSPRTALSVRIPYCSPFAVPDVPWASDSGNEGIGDGGCGSSSCSNREYILPTFQSPGGGSPTRSMTSTMGGSPTRSIMSIMGGTPTRSMMSTMGGSPTMSMMSPMGSSPPMTLMSPRGGSPMRTMSEQHSADIVGLLPQMQHLMDPLEVTSTRLIGRGSYGSRDCITGRHVTQNRANQKGCEQEVKGRSARSEGVHQVWKLTLCGLGYKTWAPKGTSRHQVECIRHGDQRAIRMSASGMGNDFEHQAQGVTLSIRHGEWLRASGAGSMGSGLGHQARGVIFASAMGSSFEHQAWGVILASGMGSGFEHQAQGMTLSIRHEKWLRASGAGSMGNDFWHQAWKIALSRLSLQSLGAIGRSCCCFEVGVQVSVSREVRSRTIYHSNAGYWCTYVTPAARTWKGKPAAIKVIPMKPLHWEPPSQHKSAASKLQQQEQSMQNIEEEAGPARKALRRRQCNAFAKGDDLIQKSFPSTQPSNHYIQYAFQLASSRHGLETSFNSHYQDQSRGDTWCLGPGHPNVIPTYSAFIESCHKLPSCGLRARLPVAFYLYQCFECRHPNVISTYTAFIESRHKLPGVPNNGKSNTTPDLATLSTTDEWVDGKG
eukprot:1021941-Pelagomonas_calceolata.AAC.4